MAAANKDKNGVQMLFPSKSGGNKYYLSDADNINGGKFITTDQNNAEKQTEGNLAFWRVLGKDVHYSDQSIGKTIRVNINAGGGLNGNQKNTWEDNPKYIWTNKDSKNAEFTYYIRCSGKISGHGIAANHVTCSSKFRGGIHTGQHNPQASCCELVLRVGEGNSSLNYNFEYNHPDYVNDGEGTNKLQANNDTEVGKWFGRKTIVWTNSDGKSVTARDYMDLDPYNANGKPKNNWKPLQEKVFRTISRGTEDGTKYNVPPLWGGMFTSRVDGFQTVDYAIVSLREIKKLI
ncbi:MAG TPA: hypothetical protein VH796_00245 [Nitrososphaeraceae archaeon]|jgi:hypothetical protein